VVSFDRVVGSPPNHYRARAEDVTALPENLVSLPGHWWEAVSSRSNDAIFLIEPESETIATWNDAAQRLWGYAPEEVVGEPVHRLVSDDRTGDLRRVVQAARRGEPVADFETVRLRKDGAAAGVSLATSPLIGATGEPLAIMVIAREVAARDATEGTSATTFVVQDDTQQRLTDLNRELRHRLQDVETLLEVLPVGIGLAYDRDCTDIRMNPTLRAMFGLSLESRESTSATTTWVAPSILLDGVEVTAGELPMQRSAFLGEAVNDVDLIVRRADGTDTHLLAFAAPLLEDNGVPRGSVGVFVDVSERRWAEEALASANAIKDEFLALVSHELRTPLTVVVGLSRQLSRAAGTMDGETFRQTVDQLQSDAERLETLIANMLVLARLDREDVVLEPVRLRPIVLRTVEVCQRRLPAHTIEVGDVPFELVEGNGQWIEQVLSNLLSNSQKYGDPSSPITVTVAVHESGGQVVVTVADRGEILEPDELERLFEPFYRSKRTSSPPRPGLGVGLTVCRRLVELQGGVITARSRDGGGAEFAFTLPLISEIAE
jgi:PAS domain S-box-containing protein